MQGIIEKYILWYVLVNLRATSSRLLVVYASFVCMNMLNMGETLGSRAMHLFRMHVEAVRQYVCPMLHERHVSAACPVERLLTLCAGEENGIRRGVQMVVAVHQVTCFNVMYELWVKMTHPDDRLPYAFCISWHCIADSAAQLDLNEIASWMGYSASWMGNRICASRLSLNTVQRAGHVQTKPTAEVCVSNVHIDIIK